MCRMHLKTKSPISIRSVFLDIDDEQDESDDLFIDFKQHQFGPQLQLLDYKQFKAARTIQRHFRGWRVRQSMKIRQHAATVLQRSWRLYISKRHLISTCQERVQKNILIMFNNASLKIQAFFRGWWVRKHINNVFLLKEMQLHSLEDLLTGYAYKLHTMMRTQHLPGLMSFCRNPDMQRMEDLIACMSYRFYNQLVGPKFLSTRAILEMHRRKFADSAFLTWVPYAGFDHIDDCYSPPSEKQSKIYDQREYDIIQIFLPSDHLTENKKKMQWDKEKSIRRKSHTLCDKTRRFCKDLVLSMKYWPMCNACKIKVTDRLLGPALGEFLDNVKASLEAIHQVANCNCQRDTRHEGYFQPCE
ncbi:uncharacterized protein [Drosophila virilis]|uniref:Uncharacterized protein n=1 Tax=Drosophila virilis TaxID=7244 RepID=B4M8U0_DROVI|nr:uncharacterized protein LOC6634261 [Drosophila virilis]EDW57616.2 uncharacterized protein Dvir_GJ18044 [Drosophila virilis]